MDNTHNKAEEPKFFKLADTAYDMLNELRKACTEYLTEQLEKAEGNRINIADIDGVDYTCVTYDGGNHPEYASNAFSYVHSVYSKNGDIYLDIDDTDEYSISRIDTLELTDVCYAVDSVQNTI